MFYFYNWRLKTIKVSFIDVFREWNARDKVRRSDLGVRKEVANFCLRFRASKAWNTIRPMYLTKSKIVTN